MEFPDSSFLSRKRILEAKLPGKENDIRNLRFSFCLLEVITLDKTALHTQEVEIQSEKATK